MKNTTINTISELMSKLSDISGINATNGSQIDDLKTPTVSGLITLSEEVLNSERKERAKQLLVDSGFGWITFLGSNIHSEDAAETHLAQNEMFSIPSIPLPETPSAFSEDEFMNLIPVNSFFH